MVCIAPNIGNRSLSSHLVELTINIAAGKLQSLVLAVVLAPRSNENLAKPFLFYEDLPYLGRHVQSAKLQAAEEAVKDDDVINVQFTSGKSRIAESVDGLLTYQGTTGTPKAALLTHR